MRNQGFRRYHQRKFKYMASYPWIKLFLFVEIQVPLINLEVFSYVVYINKLQAALNSASFELGTTLDCNFGLGEENRRKKWFLQTKMEQHPSFLSSREIVVFPRKEEKGHLRHVFFVRIEAIECHEWGRERVHVTKWRELWMRIEEKSDSYRQEGTASIIRFLERSRPLVKKGGKRTSTPRVFCTNWSHRMSRMRSGASACDQMTRTMDENRTKKWFL